MIERVFVVGLPKAGTTSIDHYLSTAGYFTWHQNLKDGEKYLQPLLHERILQSYLKEERLMTKAEEDMAVINPTDKIAFTQMDGRLEDGHFFPQYVFLRRLIAEYPDAKYILNVRKLIHHVTSLSMWGDLADRMMFGSIQEFIEQFNHRQHTVLKELKANFLLFEIDSDDAGEKLDYFMQVGNKHNWKKLNQS